jgi:catechol 2,3-dioxygenase-like lactoylglutathione lyase family enzyme
MSTTRPLVGMYAFRSTDPRRLADFWAELMELPISEHSTDELVMLDFDHQVGPVTWMFHRDPTAGTGSARLGLDIGGEGDDYDWQSIAARAEKAGATRTADRAEGAVRWVEMTDPDGNPFRVFAPRPV